jgi:DNA-binding MarR family transcriptional regulator
MEKILSVIDENLKSDEDINAIIVIEGDHNIIYTTENWDLSRDLDHINEVWGVEEQRELYLSDDKYSVLQNSNELLVAIKVERDKTNKAIPKERIIGFKDSKRKIIIRSLKDIYLPMLIPRVARVLTEISDKKPFIESKIPLGKTKDFDLTPRILSSTSKILEKVGISKIGISEVEAKVYLTLLRRGDKGEKIGSLYKELNLKRTHVYRIIERLVENNWVELISKNTNRIQYFAARPLLEMLDRNIKEKEEEIKILKGFKLIFGEGTKNGWLVDTFDSKTFQKPFDLKNQEIIGYEKDSGIVIYEYDRPIKKEENLDRVKLRLYSERLKQNIKEFDISGLDEIKIVETKIENYPGAELCIKFKENSKNANNLGKNWIFVAKLVAISLDRRIYVIWGTEEKFPYLLNIIQNLK